MNTTARYLVKTIQFEAESSRIWITLSKTGKEREFKIDLETRVNHVPPIEETIKIEPKLRQHLILAYHIQELLSGGKAQDPKQIARWLNISNVRIYQILGMLFLSPRIQEEIIFSRNPILATIPEYKINEITQETDWKNQELTWKQLLGKHA